MFPIWAIWCIISDFLKLAFFKSAFYKSHWPGWSEDIYIKSTVHISNLGEIVDPGSEKKTDAELELNTAENLEEDDTESVGVTSEVADSTKDVNGKEVTSPYSTLVNVGPRFVYTVDRNKVYESKNITEILASIYKHTLTN